MKKTRLPFLLLAAHAACAIRVPPPRIAPEGAPSPQRAWANVLSRHVDDQGRIDFTGIAKEPGDLEAFVAWIAKVSPESQSSSFPTTQARLAYYINAYNGLAVFDVVESGFPPNLEAVKIRFFYRNRFQIGDKFTSLYALENRVIRPIGDPRVHVALNCMARGCPRLPREPFRSEELDAQLDREARRFYNEQRNVRLEPGRRTVFLSQILEFYTKDFLKKAPSLIDYVNGYRQEKIPSDWKVDFIPYDWTLNSQ
jgi:Protein of unknown function, DUF547